MDAPQDIAGLEPAQTKLASTVIEAFKGQGIELIVAEVIAPGQRGDGEPDWNCVRPRARGLQERTGGQP